jgi:hypothetical protein
MSALENLFDFCETETQREALGAVIKYGSNNKAADALGKSRRTIDKMINRIKANRNKYYEPGFNTEKKTIQVGADGEVQRVWYKTKSEDEDKYQKIANAIMEHSPKPLPRVKQPRKKQNANLLDLYTFTDFHFGAVAWGKECGDSWDLSIAERTFLNCLNEMIQKAKVSNDAETAFLNLQGDILHYDSLEAITPTSKHILVGSDDRAAKMVEVVMTCAEWAVLTLLEHYKKVIVLVCEGNHDLYGSIWLRKHMKLMFKKNPRVQVDDTEFPYYAYLHGEIMLGFHHGHKKKNADLPMLFSAEPRYREMWGKANYCYIHTGHYHHREKEGGEAGGAIVERHPTLAAADSHAVRGGYISKRGAYVITYDKQLGEINRSSSYPEAEREKNG